MVIYGGAVALSVGSSRSKPPFSLFEQPLPLSGSLSFITYTIYAASVGAQPLCARIARRANKFDYCRVPE